MLMLMHQKYILCIFTEIWAFFSYVFVRSATCSTAMHGYHPIHYTVCAELEASIFDEVVMKHHIKYQIKINIFQLYNYH